MTESIEGRDQRQHRRIRLSVPARYLCEGAEEEATLTDISAGGLALASTIRPPIGARIVVYVGEIGRMEGRVIRHRTDGFAVQFEASDGKRQRLEARLKGIEDASGDASASPGGDHRPQSKPRLVMSDGREVECRVLDMSVTGVSLEVAVRPPIGEEIRIGRLTGRVSQYTDKGIAIDFKKAAGGRR